MSRAYWSCLGRERRPSQATAQCHERGTNRTTYKNKNEIQYVRAFDEQPTPDANLPRKHLTRREKTRNERKKHQPNGCQHKNRTPAFADTLRRPLFSRPRHLHVGGLKKTEDTKIDGKTLNMLLVVVPWTELGTDIAAAIAHNPFEVHHYRCNKTLNS